jgi:GntR family transcriptional regulator/MocR family aminotransferase
LHVSFDGNGDRTSRIYLALRRAVLDGRLAAGERVPTTRGLAGQLGVSRGTVTAAYERLAAEGFLVSRVGSGTFVSSAIKAPPADRRARSGRVLPRPGWPREAAPAPLPAPAAYDLSVGVPDPALFPLAVWRRLVSAELRPGRLSAPTYAVSGHPALREEVARYVGLSRSVLASADDVLLTTGAQQALDLVARVLLAPGDVVAVEDPGYPAAHRAFEASGARVRGVPVDAEGLVVDALPATARLVYVTPSHQFPTGVPMSLNRRTALLEWAFRHDAVVVEDDYDSEFRFEDRPLEPLQSLDRDGRVVYVGSFSKTLLPLLRVGYAIAPASLQLALREAKRVADWNGDLVTQGALAQFMAEGLLGAHVRRASRVYRERREVLLAGLRDGCGDSLAVVPSVAGLHVCAWLVDASGDDTAVVTRAAAAGVALEALSPRFRDQEPAPGVVLGFGGITAARIPEALARLRASLHPDCDRS